LLGRVDGIVKVGGRRVDLEAVAEQVKAHPGVRDALVTALPVGKGRENQVVALVAGDPDIDDLNNALAACLEPYARPRRIKIVAAIPVTPAGKHDHKTIEKILRDP